MAFDNGKWDQDYNSDQAESGVVDVAYNFSILDTYGALRKCSREPQRPRPAATVFTLDEIKALKSSEVLLGGQHSIVSGGKG